MNIDTLHIRLKELRLQNGLSQTEAAKLLHVSRQAISQWETGKVCPDMANIALLCDLYKISINELLDENTENPTDELEAYKDVKSVESTDVLNKSVIQNNSEVVEMIGLAVILVLASQFSFFAIIVSIVVALWLRKSERKYKPIYVLCLICFLIGLYNTFVMLNHLFFDYYIYSIEPA